MESMHGAEGQIRLAVLDLEFRMGVSEAQSECFNYLRVQLENLLALFDQLFCLLNSKKGIVAASTSNLFY